MEKCGPEGRDCIERHSTLDFNCSVTCEGIFADTVHLDVDTTEEKARGSFGQNGAELDRKKFKKLVSEYKNFKKKNCRHFRFNSAANATKFGKFQISNPKLFQMNLQQRSSLSRRFSWCRSTLTRPPSTRWRGTRRSRRRPSWVSSEAPWGSSLGSPSSAVSRSSSFFSSWWVPLRFPSVKFSLQQRKCFTIVTKSSTKNP